MRYLLIANPFTLFMLYNLLQKIFYHPRYGQFMRFAFIGGSCLILEFVLIYAMLNLLGKYPIQFWGLPAFSTVHVYNAIAFSIALTLNYLVSRFWVFQKGRYSVGKEFLAFVGVGVVALALSILFFSIGLDVFHWDWIPAKIFSVCLVLVWNFVMKKFFVFKG